MIYEDDALHIKLAKSIPADIVAKLRLNSATTIADITKRIHERDPVLFAKIVVSSNLIHTASFIVGSPSASGFIYDELYTCLMNETKIVNLERCIDAANPKGKFRRLPLSFAKRTEMLKLFNDKAPKEIKDEIAKSGCKAKTVARMNWLLNHQPVELAVPVGTDPCSEVCIVLSDDGAESFSMLSITEAKVIKSYNLVCVKKKADATPSLPDIEEVILARVSLFDKLDTFIKEEDASSKKVDKRSSKSKSKKVDVPKRKREDTSSSSASSDAAEKKPEKKKQRAEPVIAEPIEVMQVEEGRQESKSSSSTSSSEDEPSEDGPRIPQMPQQRSLFEELQKPLPVLTPQPVPVLQKSEADKERASKRAALLADYHKSKAL